MAYKIFIGGRLESKALDGIVTGANAIKDDTLNKTQREVNNDFLGNVETLQGWIEALQSGKQDVLTFDNAPTEDSNNPVKSGGVWAADKALSDAIEAILVLIPSAATTLNQLADKAFVNSSIATDTATFRGTSAAGLTEEQFLAWADSLTHDLNDYVFWNTEDAAGNTQFKRYKWNGTQWMYEYTLNNSSFTSDQWAAINSGITMALVTKLSGLPDSTALQAAFDAINNLIPSEATSSNKLADKAWVTALVNTVLALIPAEATASNQLADKAYVGTTIASSILANIPAFKGQFITLAELLAVESPKDGDIGIVRQTDSDGHDEFKFYQFLNDEWSQYYVLSYHPLHKPATTGLTGNYPYNGMGIIELPKNMEDHFPNNTWGMVVRNDVVYLLYSYQMQYYAVYDSVTQKGLTLENNLVVEDANYDISDIADIVGENYLNYTEAGGVYTITKPDTTTITSTEINNTQLWFMNQDESNINVLLQSMFTQANTIYIIRNDYDLMGMSITIPTNCVLQFDGGSISNGKAVGNNTKLLNYNGGSNALYGAYYDIEGTLLNFCYKKKNGFVIDESFRFVDDLYPFDDPNNTTGKDYNYQSMAKHGNYIFLIGYPFGGDNGKIIIRVFNASTYEYIGACNAKVDASTYLDIHANGATVANGKLYIAPAITGGDQHLYYAACDTIVSSINSSVIFDSVNLSQAISDAGLTNTSWIHAVDYDSVNKEWAVLAGMYIVILNEQFEYIRKTSDITTEILNDYGYTLGNQDIVLKNGIVYCDFETPDVSFGKVCFIVVDTINDKILDFISPDVPHGYFETQGFVKDDEDNEVLWMNCRQRNSNMTTTRAVNTICKVSPEGLGNSQLGHVYSDSYKKNLMNSSRWREFYVDNTTTNTQRYGSSDYPFKTLQEAFMMAYTCSDNVTFNLKRTGVDYSLVIGSLVNKAFRITSNGSGSLPNVKISGEVFNCYVSLSDINLVINEGMSSRDNCAFVITNTYFVMTDMTVQSSSKESGTPLFYSRGANMYLNNVTFNDLPYVLQAEKYTKCTAVSLNFNNVGAFLKTETNCQADIDVYATAYTWYFGIDVLAIVTGITYIHCPFIPFKFRTDTANHFTIVLGCAKKLRKPNFVAVKHLISSTYTPSDFSSNSKQILSEIYPNTALDLNCRTDHKKSYVYIGYTDGSFVSESGERFGVGSSGTTAQRPSELLPFNVVDNQSYYDTSLNKPIYWNASAQRWVDSKNFHALRTKGTTEQRPVGRWTQRPISYFQQDGRTIYQGYTIKYNPDNKYYIASSISGSDVTWTEEDEYAGKAIPADVLRVGTTAQRQAALTDEYVYNNLYVGFEFRNVTSGNTLRYYEYVYSMERTGEGTEESPYVYSVIWAQRNLNYGELRDGTYDTGFEYFDTSLKKTIYAIGFPLDGTVTWVESDGAKAGVVRSGASGSRPSGSSIYVGFQYQDTTLGKPIFANSISGDTVIWVDATGATV